MDITRMHIGMDVEGQDLNSETFNKLQHQEKDYILNDVIENLIRSAINKDDNTVSNIVSYQDIREYYHILEPFLKTVQLEHTNVAGDLFTLGKLPSDLPISPITSGLLYTGVKYKVLVAGTTNLTTFGGTSPPVVGDIFTCTVSNLVSGPTNTVVGDKYRILDDGGSDWTSAGAANSNPGTVFTSTASAGGTAGTAQVIASAPTWAASTKLIPVYNTGYFNIIKIDALITCGYEITSGAIVKNKMYKVLTPGTTSFKAFGGYETVSGTNVIFTCTADGTPSWAGGTIIIEVKRMSCRLVKMQDTGNFMQYSFGTSRTSPVAILADGYVRVYHDNKFTVEGIFIDYVRKPVSVNYENSVDSDVHASLHSFIVKLAARQAAGISGDQAYQSLVMESEENKKAINK